MDSFGALAEQLEATSVTEKGPVISERATPLFTADTHNYTDAQVDHIKIFKKKKIPMFELTTHHVKIP